MKHNGGQKRDLFDKFTEGIRTGYQAAMNGISLKSVMDSSGGMSTGTLTSMIIGLVIAMIVLYALYPTLSGDAQVALNSTKGNLLFNGVNGLVLVPVIIFFVVVIALMASVLTGRAKE